MYLGMFSFLLFAPFATHAASAVLTSIIPSGNALCTCTGAAGSGVNGTYTSAPDWGCVLQTLQNIINDVVGLAAIIISLFLAQAGFTYMTSSGNPEKRSLANKRILNAVIGLVIVLCAWLLVDSIMKIIYNQGSQFGPWNSILVSNGSDYCIKQQTAPGIIAALTQSGTPAQLAAGGVAPSQNPRGDCSVSGLEADGMSSSIASTMSCLTKTEDAPCNLAEKSGTDKGTDKQSVSIGMFQVNISANNLSQYPACEAQVNNQPLNCTQAFSCTTRNKDGSCAYTASNHTTYVSNQSLYNTCVQAVSNAQCNVQVAQDLYNNHGGSKNWGTAAQQNCGG
jgi:hypothetical protein